MLFEFQVPEGSNRKLSWECLPKAFALLLPALYIPCARKHWQVFLNTKTISKKFASQIWCFLYPLKENGVIAGIQLSSKRMSQLDPVFFDNMPLRKQHQSPL